MERTVLRRSWDRFMVVPTDNLNHLLRSSCLDQFLKLYLKELYSQEETGITKSSLKFSDMQSVGNVLATEFMADIQRLCNSAKSEDDASGVVNYLLEQRGWMLLQVLQHIGVKNLTCGEEFVTLLVSLLNLTCGFPVVKRKGDAQTGVEFELQDLEQCLQHGASLASKRSHVLAGRHLLDMRSTNKRQQKVNISEVHIDTSGSEEDKNENSAGRKKSKAKLHTSLQTLSKDFAFLSDYAQSFDQKGKQEEVQLGKKDVSPLELCILVLALVQDVCQSDISPILPSRSVSADVLPLLTQLLSDLHKDNDPSQHALLRGWTQQEVITFERHLIRAIFALSAVLSRRSDTGGLALVEIGLIPTLLDVARLALTNARLNSLYRSEKEITATIVKGDTSFLLDILKGILLLLEVVFDNLPCNLTYLNNALRLFTDFKEAKGFELVESVIKYLDETIKENRSTKQVSAPAKHIQELLSCLVRVMDALKRAKVDYIHAIKCLKKKHKACMSTYHRYIHHHHDTLGEACSLQEEHLFLQSDSQGSIDGQQLEGQLSDSVGGSICAAAAIALFLLKLFKSVQSRYSLTNILYCIDNSGLCCCIPPEFLIKPMLQGFSKKSQSLRNYTLIILVKLLLEQCGGAKVGADKMDPCSVCTKNPPVFTPADHTQKTIEEKITASDSALSSSEVSLQSDNQDQQKPKWMVLKVFSDLIMQENETVSSQVAKHLLRLGYHSGDELKHELFRCVFLPLLQRIKSSKTNDFPEVVSQYVVGALPHLLQAKPTQELFLLQDGVQHLCSLVFKDNLREPVLKVFEVLITADVKEAEKMASPDYSPSGKTNTRVLPSSLQQSPSKAASIPRYYSAELVIPAFLELLLESDDEDMDKTDETDFGSSRKFGAFMKDQLLPNVLSSLSDIWSTAERLVQNSKPFEDLFTRKGGPGAAYCLLLKLLELVTEKEKPFEENIELDGCTQADSVTDTISIGSATISECSYPGTPRESLQEDTKVPQVLLTKPSNDPHTVLKHKLLLIEALVKICLRCCAKDSLGKQSLTETELSEKVYCILNDNFPTNASHVIALCDTLLNCAVASEKMKDPLASSSLALMHLKEDDFLEGEEDLLELSDLGSGRDSEPGSNEAGYEADEEYTTDASDLLKANRSSYKRMQSMPPSVNKHQVIFPQVVTVTMRLLSSHCLHDVPVVNCVAQKVIALVKDAPANVQSLYNQGLLSVLLNGFHGVLTKSVKEWRVAQEFVLELCFYLARHSISSEELQICLRMINEPDPPLDALLTILNKLTESIEIQPTYCLQFPNTKPDSSHVLEETVSLAAQGFYQSVQRSISLFASTRNSSASSLQEDSLLRSISLDEKEEKKKKPSLFSGSSLFSRVTESLGISDTVSLSCDAPVEIEFKDKVTWKEGFSTSLWLRLVGGGQDEISYNKAKKARKRGKSVMFTESSEENSVSEANKNGGSMTKGSNGAKYFDNKGKLTRKNSSQRLLTDSYLHVLSVGCNEKTADVIFEVWIDPSTGIIVFRITQQKEVLTDVQLAGALSSNRWQHVSLMYSEPIELSSKALRGVVRVMVDGGEVREKELEYTLIQKRPSKTFAKLWLGHSKTVADLSGSAGSWLMGNLMIFRGTVITPGLAFHLFGLGPDCCSVSQCDSSEQEAIYMYHINPQSLDTAGINQEVLIGNRSEDLQPLRENLLMVYIPKNPQQVNMYDPCGPKDGKTLTRLAMSLSTAQKASSEKILRQPLQVKPIKGQSSVIPLMHRGIEITVDEIGGVGVFLFLFAKVVENSTEQEQASALRLLFSLLRHSKKHAQDFKEMSGYSLLAKVMSTDKFINSFQVLKVLLDACLSESVIHFNTVTKAYSFIPYAKAIIQDVSIVREILLAWKVWDKGNVEVWHLCFVALEELIKEQHPYREFNRQQLHCAKTVDKLLVTCQERIQEACPSLPLPICSSMVKIIGHMMGSPPDINIVVTVCDFLLIAHPAASTFINHTADSFWFTHHWASGKKEKKKEKQSLSSTPSKGRSPSRTWHRSVEDVVETDQRNLTADVIARERRLSVSLPSSPNTVKRQLSFKDSNFQFLASENSDSDILLSSAESRSRSQTYPPLAGCLDQKELTHALTTISTDANVDNFEDKEALNDVENEEVFPPPQVEENDNSEDIFSKARNSAHTRINVHSTTMDSDACVISLGSASEDQIEHRDTFRGGDQEGLEISARIPSKDHSTPESYMTAESGSSVNTKIADDTSPVISPGTGEVTEGGATAQSKPKELQNDSSNLLSDVSNSQSEDWELYPDPTSMNSVQVSLENANKDGIDEVDEGEKGLVVVCSGLLQLLQGVVINLCDVASKRILGMVLRPEVLLVLAHHNSPEIRTAVVQLLDVYFHRATDEQCENFLKIQGFHLLGSQLHQHQATRSLVEACLAMVFGKLHSMIDDIDPNQLSDLRPLQQSAITPVLALMEKTVYDTSLCHNAICLLIQLFETAPQMTQVMLENGLVEVLGNMVAAINKNEPRISDIIGEDEQQIVVEDIQHFAAMIAVKTFSTSGVSCYQQFDDMMTMFSILEMKEEERYGLQSRAVENVRSIQCSCFQAVLEFVETKCTIEDRGVVANLPLPYIKSASSLNDQSPLALPVVTSRRKTEVAEPGKHNFFMNVGIWQQHQQLHKPPLLGAVSLVPVTEREVTLEVSEESPESGAEDVVDTVFNLNASRTERYLGLDPSRRHSTAAVFEGGLLQTTTKKGKDIVGKLTISELIDRFKKTLVKAVDIVTCSGQIDIECHVKKLQLMGKDDSNPATHEHHFQRFLLNFLLKALAESQERQKGPKKEWNTLLWSSKDLIRVEFIKLLVFMLSPVQYLAQRTFAVSCIVQLDNAGDLLKLSLSSSSAQGPRVAYYLYELYTCHEVSFQDREAGRVLMNTLKQCDITPILPDTSLSEDQEAGIEEDIKHWAADDKKAKKRWMSRRKEVENRIIHKPDTLAKQLSTHAMEETQTVVNIQSLERSKFIDHIKLSMANSLQIKKAWHHLVEQLTHERAVWYSPSTYPKSWQLDPTEGPWRVRKRLERCHLLLREKFLKPDHQGKLRTADFKGPLTYLFESDDQMSDSAKLIYRLHTNEKITLTMRSTNVTPVIETPGEILVGENNVYFVGDAAVKQGNTTQILTEEHDMLSMTWPHEEIKELHKRRFQLRDNALEIFLTSGKTCLLAFESTRDRDQLFRHLDVLELANQIKGEDPSMVTQLWMEGRMTNFEYLTHLNKMSGRSFNDLMQYPVFPFILSNYTSKEIDLEDENIYRKLDRAISIQEKSKEEKYITNYETLNDKPKKILQAEYEKNIADPMVENSGFVVEPYHYGSLYSNSGTILHFLVRLLPFTRMHLSYQDNNFDIPDRLFHSMDTSWRLASFESSTDFKELIPEFFFLPEFLENNEGFNLGTRQGGEVVENVLLPPWCRNNPRLFILIHRQALESTYVSNNIHNWIDLIFGFKQTGKAAVEALNVFHPACYYGVDVDSIKDPLKKNASKTMIRTYGQVPKQLYPRPHVACQLPTESSAAKMISNLLFLPSEKPLQQAGRIENERRQGKLQPLWEVQNLKWGNYIGSPDCPLPALTWSQSYNAVVAALVALPTGEVFGLSDNSCLLTMYSKEKGVTTITTTDITWAGIVSWGHADSIVRIQNKKNQPPVNFLHWNTNEQITCCTSVPDCKLLFFGDTSGVVTVYSTKFNTTKACDIQVTGPRQCLYGHQGSITCLEVCKPFSIFVSAGEDGRCIIWDLNRLGYVRCIKCHVEPVNALAISDTLGDIATASYTGQGSKLYLHTINARLVAEYDCRERIFCLTYSTAPEGRSINVIAGGLDFGIIRLWSSWDLQAVRDIRHADMGTAIMSLTFTHDNQRLFSANTDGMVMMWSKTSNNKIKPQFIPFLQ